MTSKPSCKHPVAAGVTATGDPGRVRDLLRRLRNARQRALYWSGNPSFTGKRFDPRRSRGHEGYELAMCDVRNLCDALERETGRRPKESDPKREFQSRFSKMMIAGCSRQ